jgi:hypothetical protein
MQSNFCPPTTQPEVVEVASWRIPTIAFAATVMSSANESIEAVVNNHQSDICTSLPETMPFHTQA